ncbi:hypothetical protein V1478_004587, partial [Vespula squamosa]
HLSLLPGVSVNKRITAIPSFWFYPASVLLYSLRLVPTYRCSDIYGKMETFEKNESMNVNRHGGHQRSHLSIRSKKNNRAIWDPMQQPMGETKGMVIFN